MKSALPGFKNIIEFHCIANNRYTILIYYKSNIHFINLFLRSTISIGFELPKEITEEITKHILEEVKQITNTLFLTCSHGDGWALIRIQDRDAWDNLLLTSSFEFPDNKVKLSFFALSDTLNHENNTLIATNPPPHMNIIEYKCHIQAKSISVIQILKLKKRTK